MFETRSVWEQLDPRIANAIHIHQHIKSIHTQCVIAQDVPDVKPMI